MIRPYSFFALAVALIVSAVLIAPRICAPQTPPRADSFDVLIKGGMVYDGTGQPPRRVDVGIRGDRIVAIGHLRRAPNPSLMQPALPSLPAMHSTVPDSVASEMGALPVNAAADCASKVVA